MTQAQSLLREGSIKAFSVGSIAVRRNPGQGFYIGVDECDFVSLMVEDWEAVRAEEPLVGAVWVEAEESVLMFAGGVGERR